MHSFLEDATLKELRRYSATPSALNAGGLRHQIKGTWGMTAESVIKS
jgi:hypothetical protein